MAISDDRQRIMPSMADRLRSQPLAYPEAMVLTNPANPNLKGEVFLFFIFCFPSVHIILLLNYI